jgi:mannose-1-phosphate guanylyltransferase
MNVMLLAAGRGTRLGALGQSTAKALVDICGEPLLARQLAYLEDQGAERVVVNAFHLADQLRDFAAGYPGPLDLVVSVEEELLGTGGGVRKALSDLEPDPFIVLYGDVITDEPLAPIVDRHLDSGAVATLTVYESDHVAGKGLVVIDEDGYVEGFIEKDPMAVGPALINAGIYVVDPPSLRRWDEGAVFDFGYDYFPSLLERGQRILSYRLRKPVIDVGTPDGLEAGRQLFRNL